MHLTGKATIKLLALELYILNIPLHSGNHTVVALKTSEDYDVLAKGFAKRLGEINALIARGTINVGDVEMSLECFLVADYKVLQSFLVRELSNNPYAFIQTLHT